MANYPFIYRGFDPTSVVGTPTNSQLLQMIAEAKPTFKQAGMFVISSSAPNVVTYPDLAFAIWLELNLGGTALTGNQYYYNGTTWVAIPLPAGAVTNAAIADGTIEIDKFSVAGGAADQIIAVNAGATAFEFTTVVSKIANGSLSITKLAPPTAGDVLYGNPSNQWTLQNLATIIDDTISDSVIPIANVKDVTSAYIEGQVPAVAVPGGYMQPFYIEDLLRNNQTPTQKLNLGGIANAGKVMAVNAAGTDVEYQTAATTKIATLSYGGAAGTVSPDAVTGGGVAVELSWTAASEVDPASLITLTGKRVTFAATGYYQVHLVVPVISGTAGSSAGRVYFYNNTTAAVVANLPFVTYDTAQGKQLVLDFILNVTDITHTFSTWVKSAGDQKIGLYGTFVNYDGGAERYQQMTITKIG